MTVFEASIKLYEWFGENDSFHLSKDLPALTGKQIKNKEVAAAVLCGLGKLKTMGVIDETAVSNDAVWVLEKNFHTLDQDVKLSLETCQSITHIVTAFCELIGNEAEKPDPASITEQDIKNLIFVCTTLMEKRTETPIVDDK
tara:strand:+ start:1523 stop:1948 length:426 start_codon:yes stop_codon:yes gene_type:complete